MTPDNYLDCSCSKVFLDIRVCNNGQESALDERMNGILPDEMLVSLVVRVDCNSRVTQHCLSTNQS